MPLISKAVAEHPSGFVMFWLLASILILFVVNHWKAYLHFDSYYYNLNDIKKLIRNGKKITDNDCYYCKGQKAISFSYQIIFFKVKNVQLRSVGGLYGRSAGINRVFKTVKIPRSRKAFVIHSFCSLIKLIAISACIILIRKEPYSYFSLPAGIVSGSFFSCLFAFIFSTKSKVTYLLSPGMIIKILIWLICIYFLGELSILFLFFDPLVEVIIRHISRDRMFFPILKQAPKIETLLKNRYQLYLEMPVWSVINPFFRWLF